MRDMLRYKYFLTVTGNHGNICGSDSSGTIDFVNDLGENRDYAGRSCDTGSMDTSSISLERPCSTPR